MCTKDDKVRWRAEFCLGVLISLGCRGGMFSYRRKRYRERRASSYKLCADQWNVGCDDDLILGVKTVFCGRSSFSSCF